MCRRGVRAVKNGHNTGKVEAVATVWSEVKQGYCFASMNILGKQNIMKCLISAKTLETK